MTPSRRPRTTKRSRARLALGCLLVALLAGTAQAAAPGEVTSYSGTGIEHARGITTGPDGAIWFTNRDNASVGKLTVDGTTITNFPDEDIDRPYVIVEGPDGAMWFTNQDGNSIGRITTGGALTTYTDVSMNDPTGITVGPDDALWFTNDAGDSIGRITTAGAVTNFTDPSMSAPFMIVSGPDGALWYTNREGASIGRITTGGAVTTYTDDSIDFPRGLAVGSDDALWFGNEGNDSIGRITTAGVVTNFTAKKLINAPYGMTAGPDGALWFANQGNNSIGRITTSGRVSRFGGDGIENPVGITTGPDGGIWFSNADNDAIGRVEPPMPFDLSELGEDATDPKVGINKRGRAFAIWKRWDGTHWLVQGAIREAGDATFGAPFDLSAPGEDAADPEVAFRKESEEMFATWIETGTSGEIMRAARIGGEGVVGDIDTLSDPDYDAYLPEIAIDAKGNAYAVWGESDGSNTVIQTAYRPVKAAAFGDAVDLSEPGQDATDPHVAADAKGNAVAVWSRSNGANTIVQSSFRPVKTGIFGSPIDLSGLGQNAADPQVSLTAKGIAHVVYTRSNGLNVMVQGAVGILKSQIFEPSIDLSAIGADSADPQITTDSKGNAFAAWVRSDGFNDIVQSSYSPAKTRIFGTPIDLSFAGQDAFSPQIATDAKGNAMAVWGRESGLGSVIQGAVRIVKNGLFSPPAQLSEAGEDATDPELSFDGEGNPLSIWSRDDGEDLIIQATDLLP